MKKRRVPLLTLLLIAANLLAAFALVASPDLVGQLGFHDRAPTFFSAITCLFLHANIFHLLGNMLFLAAVGAAVELATGTFRFAVVYFLSGLVGVGFHYLVTRHSANAAPLIGASGCVAGCVAYYCIRYTRFQVPLAPRVGTSVLAVTGIWLLLQVVGAFVHPGSGQGGVSYWAHLGGFLAGGILVFVFRAPDLGHLQLSHEVLAQMNQRGPAAVVHASQIHLLAHPNDVKVLWDLADAQHQLGEPDEEVTTLLRLSDMVEEPELAEAMRRVCSLGRISRVPVLKRMQISDRLATVDLGVSRALLKSIVEGPVGEVRRPDAILALASIERDGSPTEANALIARLVRDYPLHPVCEVAKQRGWVA